MNGTLDLKAAAGDCCPLMTLVLQRVKKTDKVGLQREPMFSISTGNFTEETVVRFHKGDRGTTGANVSYAIVNYCPFCGTKLRAEKKGGLKTRPRSPSRRRAKHLA